MRCRCRASPCAIVVVGLALYTPCCSLVSLAWAVVLRVHLGRLQANTVGDPEKEFLDDCMRDFEGLPVENQDYIDKHKSCIQGLENAVHLRRLPRVRLTVDSRICGQADLCTGGDPGRCADRGVYGDIDYEPGDVTRCYELINRYRAEITQRRRAALLDQVELECTRNGRWNGYANEVHLRYCMWKHLSVGICTNDARTNCPKDTSCCPIAQNHLGANALSGATRPNVYTCRKSPTVGLYCQDVNDRAPGNTTGDGRGEPCDALTCPSFDWCLDLVDVPGLCLGTVCQEYRRCLGFTGLLIAVASLGLALDFTELGILFRFPAESRTKTSFNVGAAFLKLTGFLFCMAGGIKELVDVAIEKACFNEEGNHAATVARLGTWGFLVAICLAAAGSLCLAPLSARWGSQLVGLPYAKVQPVEA
mmetsp:Transcript_44112/g.89024  ORF Transcript_44112/g.89024 Transcript_44112/m.89024 type:complete len:420 (-) Transcript_44112:375-1634(-)